VNINRRFGIRVSILSFQEKDTLETSKRQVSKQNHLLHAYLLFVFLFDPEDGGDDFLQNVC
jgi:hypothetical protein